MTAPHNQTCLTEGAELRAFLEGLCSDSRPGSFARDVSRRTERWVSVRDMLSEQQAAILDRIAFRPTIKGDGFSPCSLKAHYVLNEDFVNNGSAIVVFALVGSLWTHIIHMKDQNEFTPAEKWLEGQE